MFAHDFADVQRSTSAPGSASTSEVDVLPPSADEYKGGRRLKMRYAHNDHSRAALIAFADAQRSTSAPGSASASEVIGTLGMRYRGVCHCTRGMCYEQASEEAPEELPDDEVLGQAEEGDEEQLCCGCKFEGKSTRECEYRNSYNEQCDHVTCSGCNLDTIDEGVFGDPATLMRGGNDHWIDEEESELVELTNEEYMENYNRFLERQERRRKTRKVYCMCHDGQEYTENRDDEEEESAQNEDDMAEGEDESTDESPSEESSTDESTYSSCKNGEHRGVVERKCDYINGDREECGHNVCENCFSVQMTSYCRCHDWLWLLDAQERQRLESARRNRDASRSRDDESSEGEDIASEEWEETVAALETYGRTQDVEHRMTTSFNEDEVQIAPTRI